MPILARRRTHRLRLSLIHIYTAIAPASQYAVIHQLDNAVDLIQRIGGGFCLGGGVHGVHSVIQLVDDRILRGWGNGGILPLGQQVCYGLSLIHILLAEGKGVLLRVSALMVLLSNKWGVLVCQEEGITQSMSRKGVVRHRHRRHRPPGLELRLSHG